MPYSSISKLPDTVKKLSEKKQRQWMHVFNSVYKKTNSDKDAAKAAWGTVNKGERSSTQTVRTVDYVYDRESGVLTIEGIAVTAEREMEDINVSRDSLHEQLHTLIGTDVVLEHSMYDFAVVGDVTDVWINEQNDNQGMFRAEIYDPVAIRRILQNKWNAVSVWFTFDKRADGKCDVIAFKHLALTSIDRAVDKDAVITAFRSKQKKEEPKTNKITEGDVMMDEQLKAQRAINDKLEVEKKSLEKDLEAERAIVTKLTEEGSEKDKKIEEMAARAKEFEEKEKEFEKKDKELDALRAEKKNIQIDSDLTDLEAKGHTVPAQRAELKKVLEGIYGQKEQYDAMLATLKSSKVVDFKPAVRAGRTDDNNDDKKLTPEVLAERYGITIPQQKK